jgi:CBS domain-containing protein
MNVSDLMTRSVHACRVGDRLNAAARVMWDHAVGCVPVVNHGGYVIGVLTDRDCCMAAYTTGKSLPELRVEDAMSRHVISCRPYDSLTVVEDLMRHHRVRRLPIVDDAGRLVGMLSASDLASHCEPSIGFTGPLSGDAIAMTVATSRDRTHEHPRR